MSAIHTYVVAVVFALCTALASCEMFSSTEDVVVVHQRRDYITVVKANSPLHQTLRRLAAISNKDAPSPKQEARASLPAEYSVNLLQPFGGASAGAVAEAHANQKAEASNLDKAHSGAS
ncbi:unnamed protein product, partial [Aphanomyces euteiches]